MKLNKASNSLAWCFIMVVAISFVGIEASGENVFRVANAKDFGFNETDATGALQAAINSGAQKVFIPNMGKEWIVTKSISLIHT